MKNWKGIAIAAIWLGLCVSVIAVAGLAKDGDNAAALGFMGGLVAVWATSIIVKARA